MLKKLSSVNQGSTYYIIPLPPHPPGGNISKRGLQHYDKWGEMFGWGAYDFLTPALVKTWFFLYLFTYLNLGGTDRVDQLILVISCRWKSGRWTMNTRKHFLCLLLQLFS